MIKRELGIFLMLVLLALISLRELDFLLGRYLPTSPIAFGLLAISHTHQVVSGDLSFCIFQH